MLNGRGRSGRAVGWMSGRGSSGRGGGWTIRSESVGRGVGWMNGIGRGVGMLNRRGRRRSGVQRKEFIPTHVQKTTATSGPSADDAHPDALGQKRGEGVEIRSRVGMAVRNRDGCSEQRCEGSQGEDNRMQIDNEGNGCSEIASDMRRRNMDSDKGNSILMN